MSHTRTITVPRPTVGRIVHYNEPVRHYGDDGSFFESPGPCRAAIITEVRETQDHTHTVGLALFLPDHFEPRPLATGGAARSNHPSVGHWHWPEKV